MKKGLLLIFTLFLFISNVLASDFQISAEYVLLYNLNDNKVLYEKNKSEKTQIASLTKMMSTYVGILNIHNLEDKVIIGANDFASLDGYSKAGFSIGDEVTYNDLLYGIILPSGAEAVLAVVNNTLGYDNFIEEMNNVAKSFKMNNTHFENPIGKDNKDNYSTAEDLATFLKEALKNDTFKKIFTTKKYITSNGITLKSTVSSYDDILNTSLIDGAKSGFTKGAGRCLASITTLDGVDCLLIVINSSMTNAYNAVKDTITIYDYYQSNYSYQSILTDDTFIKSIPISLSKTKIYEISGNEEVKMYLKNDTEVTYEYEGVEKIKFNTKKGEQLGVVKIYDGDNLLTTSKVYLESKISYYPIIMIIIVLSITFLFIVRRIYGKNKSHRHYR